MDSEPRRKLSPEEWLTSLLLGVMTVIVVVNVLSRYVFHAGLAFTEDLAVSLFVWMVFLGAGLSVVRRIHVGFTVLSDRLPERFQTAVDWLGMVLFVAFFGVLTIYGTSMVVQEYTYGQTTPTMGWPEWWFGAAIPVGSALAVVRTLSWFRSRGRSQ